MGLIEIAKRSFCLEKCMILASVDGFFQFLPKLVEEKVSSRTEQNGKNRGKNQPLEETAYLDFRVIFSHSCFTSRYALPLQA